MLVYAHFSSQVWDSYVMWTYTGSAMLLQSLWAYMWISPAVSRRSSFLVLSIPTGSYNHFVSSSADFNESWGTGFDGDISFITEFSKVLHSLNIAHLWVSVFVSIYRRVNLFWWLLSKTLICEYNIMSLGVILLLCFFSRTVPFGFSLSLWPI